MWSVHLSESTIIFFNKLNVSHLTHDASSRGGRGAY